ncbi:hypothetical protein SAY87_008189 [Trapa incisa]|uniref:Uncharacterized protein n=1 Tax=Trapa incisa TaxID=236973 RepID=A0AAN7QFT6_9MYRT|nr:hypothetical protein SAY87_008189 [Trapa incisa]
MAASYGIALTSTLVTPSELALGLSDPSISSASISFPSSNPSFRIAVVKAMSGSDNVDADLNAVKPSKTAAITDEATALARAGVPVIKLAGGEPDLDKPAPIVEAFAMTGRRLGYIAVGPKHFIAACGKIQSQVEHLDGRMDLESVYEDQGFFSAAVQDNHSDNAIDSDDWQRAEPTLHRNFTVRPPDENQKDPPFTKASIEGEEDDGEGEKESAEKGYQA